MSIDFQDQVTVLLKDTGMRGLKGEKGDTGDAGNAATVLTSPVFTQTAGVITRIDYAGGEFKELVYNAAGDIQTVTLTSGDNVITKTFNYTGDDLISITQS